MKRGLLQGALPPLATFLLGALLAEAVIAWWDVPALLLPRPSAVIRAAVEHSGTLLPALGMTAGAALSGLALATLAGILAAVVLSTARWVERAFYPYAIFFQIVPIVAVAPLFVIWFGYGGRAVVAAAFVVSVFPVIANTLAGIQSVHPALRELFQLYGAGRLARLWKLELPSALPFMLSGFRIAAGLAVIGAIVGEFVAGGGIGNQVLSAMRGQKTDVVFAAVLYAAGLGLALFGGVSALSSVFLRSWRAPQEA
jgi:NitT/TauT family transport system permease protein